MPTTSVEICNLALGHLGEAPIAAINDDNTRARACLKHYDTALEATLRSHRWNFAQSRKTIALDWKEFGDFEDGAGSVMTILQTAHGYSTGDTIRLKGLEGFNKDHVITVTGAGEYDLNGSVYANVSGFTLGYSLKVPAFGWSYQYTLPTDCLRVLEVNDSEQGDNRSPWIIESDFLLTNQDTCNLVYIAKITDVAKFDPLFVDAFALSLAVRLTESIRGATAKTEQLTAQYERITAPLARRVDSNEARRRKPLKPMNSLAIQARFRNVTG